MPRIFFIYVYTTRCVDIGESRRSEGVEMRKCLLLREKVAAEG